jgi:hypothetical protein
MELPDAAIRWILEFSVSSNIELFRLANVNRRTRGVIKEVLLHRAKNFDTAFPLDELLLPCMLKKILRDSLYASIPNHHTDCNHNGNSLTETFCAAWFHPNGINEYIVSLEDDDESLSVNSYQSFAPGGEQNISDSSSEGDARSRRSRGSFKQRNRRARSRSPASRTLSNPEYTQLSPNDIICCKEWVGYREATQVLKHFGASQVFVHDLINAARKNSEAQNNEPDLKEHDATISTLHPIIAKPTFAVRGATVARPDNYCFCRDAQEEREQAQLRDSRSTKKVTGWKDIRQHEFRQTIARIRRRRKEDQRSILPRVLRRASDTPSKRSAKSSIPQTIQAIIPQSTTIDGGNTNDDTVRATNKKARAPTYSSLSELFTTPITEEVVSAETTMIDSSHTPLSNPALVIGRRQKSVQFLNSDGSHAVCMTTPPFACGPLSVPLTIFCVGIATEDGCFLSGLHHRFELGHMYPNSAAAEFSELSAVCVTTAPWGYEDHTAGEQAGNLLQANMEKSRPYDSPNSDDSSVDASDDDGTKTPECECAYQFVEKKLEMAADEDDVDDEEAKTMYHGQLAPGTWHCYVVVVNGDDTQIRVDGIAEKVSSRGVDNASYTAMLDGLTIGSDHKWDMSLCCGFGSGGEGEGAIAELAVFNGCLSEADIEVLEKDMMIRHNIPPVSYHSNEERSQDHEWMRQAQALFVRPDSSFDNIPLRYMSRHRAVAWKQFHAVTGVPMIQQKIGARAGGESSEW